MPLVGAPAITIAERVASGEVTAAEVFAEHRGRIDPAVNAVVALAGFSEPVDGPLRGVPFTVKDNIAVGGLQLVVGVPERVGLVADRDAVAVARLRAAGAVVMGKTNCPPWGGGLETVNDVFGRTNNPYDLARTAGGSSGGEAAAVASGCSAFGLGTDSGASVRLPAHFCGLAALKPTAGRVPIDGVVDDVGPVGPLRDPRTQIGILARTVADVALVLAIIEDPARGGASPAAAGSLSLPARGGPLGGSPAAAGSLSLPARGGPPAEAGSLSLPARGGPLGGSPAAGGPLSLPARGGPLGGSPAAGGPLGAPGGPSSPAWPVGAGAAQAAAALLADVDGLSVAVVIDDGIAAPDADTARVVAEAAEALAGAGALVGAAAPPPGGHALTEEVWASYGAGAIAYDLLARWDAYRSAMLGFDADVILSPVYPTAAPPHGEVPNLTSYTTPYNLSGWPAATVRCGTSADGLPIGVQVAARPWRDDVALSAAAALEAALGGYEAP